MNDQWLTIVEYARACNVSDMTVRRRIRNGKLNAILRDGKYLIPFASRPSTALPAHDLSRQSDPDSAKSNFGINREHLMVKSHPQAQTTYGLDEVQSPAFASLELGLQKSPRVGAPVSPASAGGAVVQKRPVDLGTSHILPKALSVPVSRQETVSIEAMALIEFCESMVRRLDKSEEAIRKEYLARTNELEARLQAKEMEVMQLKQQVEDLQLLVSVIDRSK